MDDFVDTIPWLSESFKRKKGKSEKKNHDRSEKLLPAVYTHRLSFFFFCPKRYLLLRQLFLHTLAFVLSKRLEQMKAKRRQIRLRVSRKRKKNASGGLWDKVALGRRGSILFYFKALDNATERAIRRPTYIMNTHHFN